ncbi:MAG TPA: hypothetical protein VMU09_07420 [Acidimicrobiales bacterium]|nr:hypothetical protein [Acidimicrobiales bacterium]
MPDPDAHAHNGAPGARPDADVAYDTDGWTNRQRARFTETLLDAGISHEWSGTELVVAREHEAYVDGLIYPEVD